MMETAFRVLNWFSLYRRESRDNVVRVEIAPEEHFNAWPQEPVY